MRSPSANHISSPAIALKHPLEVSMSWAKLAPNMKTLLFALNSVAFKLDGNDVLTADERGPTERSNCLSALMQLLSEQADHDGFKLITINTEPKRVIMACNRQGKPPSSQSSSADPVAVTSEKSNQEPVSRRHGRSGTSIRCGCRMRVNINFHTKLQAWRITSFECTHNHPYATHQELTEQNSGTVIVSSDQRIHSDFQFTESDARAAVHLYRQKWGYHSNNSSGRVSWASFPSRSADETDAAKLLQSLSSNATPNHRAGWCGFNSRSSSISSPSVMTLSRNNVHLPGPHESDNRKARSHSNLPSPLTIRLPAVAPANDAPQTAHPAVKNEGHIIPSISSTGILLSAPVVHNQRMFSPVNNSNTGNNNHDQYRQRVDSIASCSTARASTSQQSDNAQLEAAPSLTSQSSQGNQSVLQLKTEFQRTDVALSIKDLTSTAIEIDRYAMLHSAFKKLIAMGCKRREWSEEVMANIGKMSQWLEGQGAPNQEISVVDSNGKQIINVPSSPGGLMLASNSNNSNAGFDARGKRDLKAMGNLDDEIKVTATGTKRQRSENHEPANDSPGVALNMEKIGAVY